MSKRIYIIIFIVIYLFIILQTEVYGIYKMSYKILAYKIKIKQEEIQEVQLEEIQENEENTDGFIVEIHK